MPKGIKQSTIQKELIVFFLFSFVPPKNFINLIYPKGIDIIKNLKTNPDFLYDSL